MKYPKYFLLLLSGLLLADVVNAASPREQWQQMLEQLQQSPNDNVLREKLIKLVPKLKPAPAVPDAAIAFEGRAQFAFRSAKSEGDYLAAAQEYEKAVAVAPWVLGYYADLCTIYEKAGKYDEAKRHCVFYLTGLTDSAQMTEVKRRIGGLEYGIEQANTPQAQAARQLQRDSDLVRSLNGVRFDCPDMQDTSTGERKEHWIMIEGNQLTAWVKMLQIDPDRASVDYVGQIIEAERLPITKTLAQRGGPNWEKTYRISSDRIVRNYGIDGHDDPSITCIRR